MGRAEKRICLNCGEAFTPEARNARHQRYCTQAPCKAASKYGGPTSQDNILLGLSLALDFTRSGSALPRFCL